MFCEIRELDGTIGCDSALAILVCLPEQMVATI